MSSFKKFLKSILMIITVVCMTFVICSCEKKQELSNNTDKNISSTDGSVRKNEEDESSVSKKETNSSETTIGTNSADATERLNITKTAVETTKSADYKKEYVVNFKIKKVSAVRFDYMNQTTEVLNVLETTQEIKTFLKCTEADAWNKVKDGENWPKYSPALPKEYGLIIEGTQNELAIIHLYTENAEKNGAVSLAVYEDMILKPEEYAPYRESLGGFSRYWVEKDAYNILKQILDDANNLQ